MVQVVTFETNEYQYSNGLLKYTCEENGFPLEVLGIGDEWVGTRQKVFAYLEYLKGIAPDEIVICCDNRDVIIPSKPEEIVAKFKEMGGDCYFSAELASFPIWELFHHFDYPTENNYRPEVKVLNSGVGIGYAGVLVDVFEKANSYYDKSFDMNQHLISNYQISQKDINYANEQYPSYFGLGQALKCDQLTIQLTYLETDLISLDYDNELLCTSAPQPNSWEPVKKWRKTHYHPYGTLFDMDFNWGSSYQTVYNTYNGTHPLIYHSCGPEASISHLRKVLQGDFLSSQKELLAERKNAGELETFSQLEQFIDANEDKEKFVCWKNRNTSPLYDVIDLCVQRNKILVIICPLFKAYSRDLMYMITNKTKNVRIYETSKMANGAAMRARAGEYQKNFDDAILIPEDLYIGVDSAPE